MTPELFAATDQNIARDRAGLPIVLILISLLLLLLWTAWMFFARISVYATTDQARVEVAQTAFIVQAPVSGRVIKSSLTLGRMVQSGDELVELESQAEQLKIAEETTHQAALESAVSNLREQMASERGTLQSESGAGNAATQQAQFSLAKAEEEAKFAQKEADIKAMLFKDGLASQLESDRYQAAAREKSDEADAARRAVAMAQRQQLMHGGERRTRIQSVMKEIDAAEGELAASRSTMQRLEHDLDAHRIVASGSGRLGEVAGLRPGSFVREGDRLAAIIPDGKLRVVANFDPSEAIGRVRPGQKAWLRLTGFPYGEYGSIIAYVTGVGEELRDGRVRVELSLRQNSRVPLQHGLPGILEVEVERISPVGFLMRKAGGYLAAPAKATVASR